MNMKLKNRNQQVEREITRPKRSGSDGGFMLLCGQEVLIEWGRLDVNPYMARIYVRDLIGCVITLVCFNVGANIPSCG